MATGDGRYALVSDVLAVLGESPQDAPTVADIGALIPFIEDQVDLFCRCTLAQEIGVTRTYSAQGTPTIVLGHFLQTLTSVTLVSTLPTGTTPYTFDLTPVCVPQPDNPTYGRYRWIDYAIQYYFRAHPFQPTFPYGSSNIQVVGDWGWAQDQIPSPVKMAIAWAIKHVWDRRRFNEFVFVDSGAGRLVQATSDQDASHYFPKTARNLLSQFVNSRALT